MRGRLEIVEAVVDVDGTMIFGSPKSHQHRSVPVPKFLRADLVSAAAGYVNSSRALSWTPSPTGSTPRALKLLAGGWPAATAAGSVERQPSPSWTGAYGGQPPPVQGQIDGS